MSAAISSAHAVSGSVATLRSRRATRIGAVRSIKVRAEAEKPNFKGWKDIDIKQAQLGTAKIPSGIDEEVFCSRPLSVGERSHHERPEHAVRAPAAGGSLAQRLLHGVPRIRSQR